MRPAGVFERMRDLGRSERRLVQSWKDRALRVELTYFVDLCARLWFGDHGPRVVLQSFDAVEALLDDPNQLRTGSDFEARCLAVVRELRPMVSDLSDASFDEQDSVIDVLCDVPPLLILGECEHESHFDLICWNEANSLAEGVQTPYLAARHIASEDFHEPPTTRQRCSRTCCRRGRPQGSPAGRRGAGSRWRSPRGTPGWSAGSRWSPRPRPTRRCRGTATTTARCGHVRDCPRDG